ncbi:MAG: phage holin family protein [Ferruginibacter sp.]
MMQNAVSHKVQIELERPGNKKLIMDTRTDESFQTLFDKSKDYVETRIELIKLKAIDRSADVVSSSVSVAVMVIAFLFFFIIFNIGLALLLGELLGKTYYGFFIVAAIYLITGLLFKSFGDKWIKTPVSTIIIKKLFK